MEQIFIDRFIIPETSKAEFIERMTINRNLISKLPGFIRDDVYKRNDEQGNTLCITVAVWESEAAIANAKEQVQADYKKTGFDMPGMLQRLNIKMERGQYRKMVD